MKGIANASENLLYDEFGVNAELLIDHALGVGDGYKGKQFQVVATAKAAATSDHIPVIFDFELT